MRIAYLDCFAGIAGDMFLGALLDAGVPAQVLHEATAALGIGATLKIETVDRSGISSTKVHVLEGGELADHPGTKKHEHSHEGHGHKRGGQPEHSAVPEQETGPAEFAHTHQLRTQHLHKTGHPHTQEEHSHGHEHGHSHEDHHHEHDDDHEHAHVHGRSLTAIRGLITASKLNEAVKRTAIRTFEFLGRSEAKIHNVPVDDIHFHEVGAVDAIVDIVAASAGIHHLQIGQWYASAVNVGGGTVKCAHGTFPVPAPATADLLRGYPTYSAHVEKELVTPTGAALLRALEPTFGQQPAMRVDAIGYGAGTRDPKDFPNVLRLSVGEAAEASLDRQEQGAASRPAHDATQVVTVLETALDDSSPQLLAYVAEKALAGGALDVMLTPVIMKKGRPGTLLTVLCDPKQSEVFEQLLLRETSTLGVRIRQDRRACLERTSVSVDTPYGTVRMKVGTDGGEERNVAPEFEDCRAAAGTHGVPLKQVQQAAYAAYAASRR